MTVFISLKGKLSLINCYTAIKLVLRKTYLCDSFQRNQGKCESTGFQETSTGHRRQLFRPINCEETKLVYCSRVRGGPWHSCVDETRHEWWKLVATWHFLTPDFSSLFNFSMFLALPFSRGTVAGSLEFSNFVQKMFNKKVDNSSESALKFAWSKTVAVRFHWKKFLSRTAETVQGEIF